MGCCGQIRRQITTGGTTAQGANGSQPMSKFVLYEYTGATGMTVAAPVSGSKYRFVAPGVKVQVDIRDVGSMSALPNLRRTMP